MRDQIELTSIQYWDEVWAKCPLSVVSASDPAYGKKGWFLRFMDRECGSLQGKSVIEVGGAMSYRMLALARFRGVVPTVVDYSSLGLDKTRELFALHGIAVNCIQADMYDISGCYDLVTHWGVLEHQTQVGPFINQCSRLAKHQMIFSMPNMLALGAYGWKRYSPNNLRYHILHSDAVIHSACADCGFNCKPRFFGPPLICMTPIENANTTTAFLSLTQSVADRLGRIVPYQHGLRAISQNRAFVCTKQNPVT
jgi:2-polyprenyl-3-methyl-5-hydroxy-6-metoxy-1,4-benzoquinol methylase